MNFERLNEAQKKAFENVVGVLNFSSGDVVPAFFKSLDDICLSLDQVVFEKETPLWRKLAWALWKYLDSPEKPEAFVHDTQARRTLIFAFRVFIPQYRVWHRNLLFHQTDDGLFNSFSVGQIFRTILLFNGGSSVNLSGEEKAEDFLLEDSALPMDISLEIPLRKAMREYDDFIGYRPIPVLHTKQKMQPYQHEWTHAVPLYIKGAGVQSGRYGKIVSMSLEILKNLDDVLVSRAMFDFSRLEELSYDPRALDFEHPVNRRLNYHFGGWDPTDITNQGYYRRFVLIESTLQSILLRVETEGEKKGRADIPREELEFEAAAVLAGTMLMGSAVSGWGPGALDSSETFAVLLPRVAELRDEFYDGLLKGMSGPHADRLREEALALHQPFASARQFFNRNLAKLRALQYQNVQLARLYAWMGYDWACRQKIESVSVPSARMRCEMECLLMKAHLEIDHDRVLNAIPMLYQVEATLHDAIECGAVIDPWYILGFGGQFPLSNAVEDSTPDQRADELAHLVASILSLYSRLMRETTAQGFEAEEKDLQYRMLEIAQWWDQFATVGVSDVRSISGQETYDSTNMVVSGLREWYEAGTEAGDIAFWRPRVADFSSAKAYTLLIEALLDQDDTTASMALLANWLSQSELLPLDEDGYSFHPLALRWMEDLWYPPTKEQRLLCRRGDKLVDQWNLAKRFVGLIEANAEVYGEAPRLHVGDDPDKHRQRREDTLESQEMLDFEAPDVDSSELYKAAWDEVSYKDTTDDGIDSNMMDDSALRGSLDDFPLMSEMERISDRLLFIITHARLWKMAAVFSIPFASEHDDRSEILEDWTKQAGAFLEGLRTLLSTLSEFHIEQPDFMRPVAMMEYEKKVAVKYSLMERIVSTCSELLDAQQLMRIADVKNPVEDFRTWEEAVDSIIHALLIGDRAHVRRIWNRAVELLLKEPILYVPLERGGDPNHLIRIRTITTALQRLLTNLPLQGMIAETFRLLEIIQGMERQHPVGMRAITRYDDLFELGCKGILSCILRSSSQGAKPWDISTTIPLLDKMIDLLARNWTSHSRGIRLTSLDMYVSPSTEWRGLRSFIQEYGGDLLSPVHLNFSNIQAIHHQGVEQWLNALIEGSEEEVGAKLVRDISEGKYSQKRAEVFLDVIIECLLERYGTFIDYNTTTTQSDKGENLYILLDFLRLLCEYDRLAWDMRPFVTAHSVMVQEQNYTIADSWQSSVANRTNYVARSFLRRYQKLCDKYGIVIKTIHDRLSEKFVKPMSVNKLIALLEPSIREAREGDGCPSFVQFLDLVEEFSAQATGTGFEPPAWLEEIEDFVQKYRNRSEDDDEMLDLKDFIPAYFPSEKEINSAIFDLESECIMPYATLNRLDASVAINDAVKTEDVPTEKDTTPKKKKASSTKKKEKATLADEEDSSTKKDVPPASDDSEAALVKKDANPKKKSAATKKKATTPKKKSPQKTPSKSSQEQLFDEFGDTINLMPFIPNDIDPDSEEFATNLSRLKGIYESGENEDLENRLIEGLKDMIIGTMPPEFQDNLGNVVEKIFKNLSPRKKKKGKKTSDPKNEETDDSNKTDGDNDSDEAGDSKKSKKTKKK